MRADLVKEFVANLPEPLRRAAPEIPHLHAAVVSLVARGERASPDIPDTPELTRAFLCHTARLVDEQLNPGELVGWLQGRCAGDLFLATACLRGEPAALSFFERRCLPGLRAVIGRLDLRGASLDDVLQTVWQKTLVGDGDAPPKLASFRGGGDLRRWVEVIALRLALNLNRKAHREIPLDPQLDPSGAMTDQELCYLKSLYREDFKRAFQRAVEQLPVRDRNLLRFHLVERLTLEEIGALHGTSRSATGRWLQEVRDRLRLETWRLLPAGEQLSQSDFESMVRLVISQLDGSLHRLLTVESPAPGDGPE